MINKAMRFLGVLVLGFLPACLHVNVSNNAFADTRSLPSGFPYESTFYVETPVQENRLFAKEVAHKIEMILRDKGYTVVHTMADADYILTFTMAMKPCRYIECVPRYVPGPIQTTHSKVRTNEGKWIDAVEETQSSGYWDSVEEERVVFKKDVTIKVYDDNCLSASDKGTFVWSTVASSSTSRDDLRSEIDYLLLAAFKHFGKNTHKKIYTNVESRDVKMLRRDVFRD